jgi:large subunit ribosomal protein L19
MPGWKSQAAATTEEQMDLIKAIEAEQLKDGRDEFRIGDTVKVHFSIVEGRNERVQVYEGLVIARNNGGARQTFTVRKMSYGVGVERVFPVHSPRIQKIEVVRRGKVRRSKLYYIRERVGKRAKVAELIQPRARRSAAAEE